ncbi:MAG: type II toxin-antitoxin system RelE/ParE family toxin [Phycisphaeraceae bacterium]
MQWEVSLHERLCSLSDLPKAHPISEPESRAFGRDGRKTNFGDCLIFYRIDDEQRAIYILVFMHGARR